MLNPRALAFAVVATGVGAVLFLSGQQSASPEPAGGGPVPVAIPPTATEVPTPHPAVPAAALPAPVTPSAAPKPKRASAPAASSPAPKPKRSATVQQVPPVTSEQPQPAGVESNGSGGWQLPACYDETCVAQPEAYGPERGTGTQALNAGPLGQAGIVNTIADLIGRH